jgi:CMP/dCMP kinase
MRRPARIAIDGPAGSGKSTVGEQLAHTLGYLYVDTGAMYRALAWLALQEQIDVSDAATLVHTLQQAEIVVSRPTVADGRQYTVTVNGRDITWEIRSAPVTQSVSAVSTHSQVREIMRARQRALAAQEQGVVMVGRDIGSVVLADAELKVYLNASLEERAERRRSELVARQGSEDGLPTLDEVIEDIRRRDALDHDNMRPAHDAIVIMTDNLSVPQVLEMIAGYLEEAKETR